MQITRVFDILDQLKSNYIKEDIVAAKENNVWKKYSTEDFISNINYVSYGLLNLGLKPGDKVAVISNNRPEWNFVDFGCQQAGIISVPIFPTISTHDLQFILNNAEVKAVFLSSKDIYAKLVSIENEIPTVKYVHSFNEIEGVNHFSNFIEYGKKHPREAEIEAIKKEIHPHDLFTILYTSGTTGVPKGVMLSHSNLLSNVLASVNLAPFKPWWKALSFLPLNHVYERMVTTLYLHQGVSIYYAEGIETVGDNLKEVQPQMFVSVPRLLERVYEKMLSAGEKLKGWKRKLFFKAVDFALSYDPEKMTFGKKLQRKIYDALIYSKWRAALGGKLVCMVSGGAALQPRLARVFLCAKIVVLEGYGLTETSPVIAVNSFKEDGIRIGTVGEVVKDTRVKIADDGEILVKGPGVMLGYYENEAATKEVIDDDGWFHTGDIGTFVDGKYLKITDRKKEIFKTSSGKYIAPLMIENKLKECRFVEQCCVIGEGQKFASALLVLSPEYVKEWCRKHGVEVKVPEDLAQNEEVRKEVNRFVREMNKDLAPYEQIKKPELLSKPWTIEGGELTPKLSMKRKVILKKHEDLVKKIYSE